MFDRNWFFFFFSPARTRARSLASNNVRRTTARAAAAASDAKLPTLLTPGYSKWKFLALYGEGRVLDGRREVEKGV